MIVLHMAVIRGIVNKNLKRLIAYVQVNKLINLLCLIIISSQEAHKLRFLAEDIFYILLFSCDAKYYVKRERLLNMEGVSIPQKKIR